MEHVSAATRDQAFEHVLDASQGRMFEVDDDVVPFVEPERARAFVGAAAEERAGRQDVAAT